MGVQGVGVAPLVLGVLNGVLKLGLTTLTGVKNGCIRRNY